MRRDSLLRLNFKRNSFNKISDNFEKNLSLLDYMFKIFIYIYYFQQ